MMPAPTTQEIRRKALELYYGIPVHVGLPPPEDVELKDRNMWREAQVELMRTWGVELGEGIRKGVESPPIATKEYLDYLKGELDKLEGMIREVKATPKRRRVGERIRTMRIIEQVGEKQEALSLLLEREPLLERAWAGDPLVLNWLEARGLTVDDLEAEVEYLKGVVADPPQEIPRWILLLPRREITPPIVLKDHTEGNISALAMQVQTEGWIGVRHDYKLRHWTPIVRVGMAPEEPVEYTARLLSIRHERIDGYEWSVERAKAERTLALIEPLLMADKKEEAKYMLNMTGIRIPDTYIRPIYYTIHEAHRKAVFLYAQYVDFPVKHSLILHIGDPLPKPLKPLQIHPLQYTPDRKPIYWHEGKTLHQNDLYTP